MIVFSPNDRISIVAKSGSGKTTLAIVIAALLVPYDDPDWQVWWIDSCGKPDDLTILREWGFGTTRARKLIQIKPENGPVEYQVQVICLRALARRNVLVVIDEYKHVTLSTRRAGSGVEGIHLRGRGLNVGMLGLTQEPVDIPRQLLSQANHLILGDVAYPADLKYVRTLYDGYERPPTMQVTGRDGITRDRRIGFYHCYIDGDATWRYYPHVRAWHDRVRGVDTTGGVDKADAQATA